MIQTVKAQFNGQWVNLTFDSLTGEWIGEFTPEVTSFHEPGGYYSITVEAENDTGTITTKSGDDLEALRLIVNEKDPPQLTLISPPEGYVTTNQPEIIIYAEDEPGGSQVNIESLVIQVDGEPVTGADWQLLQNDYRIAWKPSVGLSEGPHTIDIQIADNDGNIAVMALSYVVDTLPPSLFLAEPRYRNIFDTPTITLSGTAADATDPVTVRVDVDGETFVETVVLAPFGRFSWVIPLEVGGNHITVTAMDGVGWETTEELFFIRLITDRTEEDVIRLKNLLKKPWTSWPQTDKETYLAARFRGAYNYTDINRVNLAMGFLAEKFAGYGYPTVLTPVDPSPGRTEWIITDFPTPDLMAGYLANVRRIAALAPVQDIVPQELEAMTFEDANAIEQVLVDVDKFALYVNNAFYAGEIYSGEV